jgi:hypothetical protein
MGKEVVVLANGNCRREIILTLLLRKTTRQVPQSSYFAACSSKPRLADMGPYDGAP